MSGWELDYCLAPQQKKEEMLRKKKPIEEAALAKWETAKEEEKSEGGQAETGEEGGLPSAKGASSSNALPLSTMRRTMEEPLDAVAVDLEDVQKKDGNRVCFIESGLSW